MCPAAVAHAGATLQSMVSPSQGFHGPIESSFGGKARCPYVNCDWHHAPYPTLLPSDTTQPRYWTLIGIVPEQGALRRVTVMSEPIRVGLDT
jgi:hypothetical protein